MAAQRRRKPSEMLCISVLVFAAFSGSVSAVGPRSLLSFSLEHTEGCKTKDEFSCAKPATVECGANLSCNFPDVCDYEDRHTCKDVSVTKQVCSKKPQCQPVKRKCGPELTCKWNERCAECDGDGCVRKHTCRALHDIPKQCTPKPHYKCKPRPQKDATPGYFGGYKYHWMADKEWKADALCGEERCPKDHHCAKADAEHCVVDPEYEKLARGIQCGDNKCDPGYECQGAKQNCKDVKKVEPECTVERIHACVKPDKVVHHGYRFKPLADGHEACGPYECPTGDCHQTTVTKCLGPAKYKATFGYPPKADGESSKGTENSSGHPQNNGE